MADGDGVQLMRFACHQCRARKLKCNRLQPCQRCSQLGEDCQYSETRQRPGHAPRRPKVKELQHRLSRYIPISSLTPSTQPSAAPSGTICRGTLRTRETNSMCISQTSAELEHRLKPQLEIEQNAGGRVFGDQAYAKVVPTGRLEQLPPQSVIDELYVPLKALRDSCRID